MPPTINREEPLAIVVTVCAVGIATFTAMDAIMKDVGTTLGAYNILFWRSAFCSFIGLAAMIVSRNRMPPRAARRLHMARGFFGLFSGLLFFWGLIRLPLAEAIALSFIAPLIALILAALILREKLSYKAILGAVLGFIGVLVIVSGRMSAVYTTETLISAAAMLLSALFYAMNLILQRQQAQSCPPIEIAFFNNFIVLCLMLLVAPWFATPPNATQWVLIGAAGMLQFISLLCLSWAWGRAEAQQLLPIEYTAFIWAAILGWIFFCESVTLSALAGTGLIVVGCVLAALAKQRIRSELQQANRATEC
ncbi:MAG: DMT family transporter [Hyphomonadaceae bacterium]|nr:DMT family transporter [Hyphomonadaceae bacterium]